MTTPEKRPKAKPGTAGKSQERQGDNLFLNFLEQAGAPGQNPEQRPAEAQPPAEQSANEGGEENENKKRFEWHGNRQQERRRKDNIQTCVTRLAELVPACSDPSQLPTKLNQGLVLKKTTQYIRELEATNRQLMRLQQGAVQQQLVSLRARIHHLKYENQMLKVQLGEAPPASMMALGPPPRDLAGRGPDGSMAPGPPIAPAPPAAPSFPMALQMQMQPQIDLSNIQQMQ
eukprot:comp23513_c0_seq1/m.39474 comp23513_c0_seq1/g.39474  ORF comp23513_c0_seq1/g.39474 comp23513_c0_seq1/m.39474 type:complete len:230 (-) comp23513_c0_seq1:152-841(-)